MHPDTIILEKWQDIYFTRIVGAWIVQGALRIKIIRKKGYQVQGLENRTYPWYIKCKMLEKLRWINPKLIKWRPHCTELMSASKIGCIQIFAAKKLSIYNFSTSAAQHLIELGQFLQNYLQHLMIYIIYVTCIWLHFAFSILYLLLGI